MHYLLVVWLSWSENDLMKAHNSIPARNFMGNYKAALSKVHFVASFHFSFINLGE